MAFSEDFTPYFADFGVAGTLADLSTVTGIFDRAHVEALGGEVSGTEPVFLVKSSDVAARSIVFRTAITIGGQAYTVRDLHPDGTGLTTLELEVTA